MSNASVVEESLAAQLDLAATPSAEHVGEGALDSAFAVSDLASASVAVAGRALASLVAATGLGSATPAVRVDRRLASAWFGFTLKPDGWQLPDAWDPIAGNYRAADGWVRLHTNARHHRDAAMRALELARDADREAVAAAVASARATEVEAAVVAAGGCAAEARSLTEWRCHPQGRAIAAEPLVTVRPEVSGETFSLRGPRLRPLEGVRVLDCTRVLAGPTCTRLLAGYGADVLRIDPLNWDESTVPEMTLGKRCAHLDLRRADGRNRFLALLRNADVFVHGYRGDALEGLGLGDELRRETAPGLVDVALCAYGWSGPWRHRRGFDTVVQVSAGLAAAETVRAGEQDKLLGLPVQALDYATGYLMAAACLRGLERRIESGRGVSARLSLARTAHLLSGLAVDQSAPSLAPLADADLSNDVESTAWGPARRWRPPLDVDGTPMRWTLPAGPLRVSEARWASA